MGALVALLVTVSAVARFTAALGIKAPWIAPDEMVYALSGRSFWETGDLQALGFDAPFYSLYPMFAGLPLALLGPVDGLVLLKATQAVLVSLTAAIAYRWARDIVSERWALVAAAMTAALPALAYSSLIMSEAAYLPAATLALLATSRLLQQPTVRNHVFALGAIGLAISMRLQGVVLLPTLLIAVAMFARFGRRTARPLVPLASALTAVLIMAIAVVATGVIDRPLGAYTGAATTSYEPATVLHWIALHAGDAVLLTLGLPIVATLILAVGAARGSESDPAVQALLAVALAYLSASVVVVGTFASVHVQQLAERDLITVAPPTLVAFAVWLERGLPRPQPRTAIVAVLVAVPVVLLPVSGVITEAAFPDAFMTGPLIVLERHWSTATVGIVWAAAAVVLLFLPLVIPRSAIAILPSVVLVCLVAVSVLATEEMQRRSEFDRRDFFGAAPTSWIDRTVHRRVAYIYDGHPLWNAVWHTAFWNESVTTVASLRGQLTGVSTPRAKVHVEPNGRILRFDGTPLRERLVVAPRNVTVVGTRVREIAQGPNQPGLVVWRTQGPPMLRTWTVGTVAKGDVVQHLRSTIYDCRPGTLAVSLSGGDAPGLARLTLRATGEGRTRRTLQSAGSLEVTLPPGSPWTGSLRLPRAAGTGTCVLTISSDAARLRWIDPDAARPRRSHLPVFAAPGKVALCYSEASDVLTATPRCR